MARKALQLTEGEWAIIRAVWEHEPCAAPTVQEALADDKGWSYSTVKTLMDRMAAKDLLIAERLRNLILYRSTITRAEAQSAEIERTARRAFDGALAPVMQFLVGNGNLTEKELDELQAMIQEQRARGSKPRDHE